MPSECKTGPGKAFREGLSLPELFEQFPNDAAAEAWFVQKRWIGGKPVCPTCGHEDVQTGAAHKSMPFRCRNRTCRKRFSVKTGTAMQSSNLGYQTWAIAMYLVITSIKGVSSMRLRRDLKITQKSAWHLAHRIRMAFGDELSSMFEGPAEVDEAYFGGKESNKHADKKLNGGPTGSAPPWSTRHGSASCTASWPPASSSAQPSTPTSWPATAASTLLNGR